MFLNGLLLLIALCFSILIIYFKHESYLYKNSLVELSEKFKNSIISLEHYKNTEALEKNDILNKVISLEERLNIISFKEIKSNEL